MYKIFIDKMSVIQQIAIEGRLLCMWTVYYFYHVSLYYLIYFYQKEKSRSFAIPETDVPKNVTRRLFINSSGVGG